MATVTITYSAVSAPSTDIGAKICGTYVPNNAAADLPAFDGTYYDTNVEGFGEGTSLEAFFAQSVAHPGLILALKRAQTNGSGTYEYETTDEAELAYLEEVSSAVASQGFEIDIDRT